MNENMDTKTQIIKLLDKATETYRFDAWENTDKIADYLIANGITVQKTGVTDFKQLKEEAYDIATNPYMYSADTRAREMIAYALLLIAEKMCNE